MFTFELLYIIYPKPVSHLTIFYYIKEPFISYFSARKGFLHQIRSMSTDWKEARSFKSFLQ